MGKRFFFDWIHAKPARTAVSGQDDLAFLAFPDKTETAQAFNEFTVPGAKNALDFSVRKFLPVSGRDNRVHNELSFFAYYA